MEPEFLGTGLRTGILQNEDMGLLKGTREDPAFSDVNLRQSGGGSGHTKYYKITRAVA
jgi:hypothetical protein